MSTIVSIVTAWTIYHSLYSRRITRVLAQRTSFPAFLWLDGF